MAYWLIKSEPDAWSWDQQVKAGAKTCGIIGGAFSGVMRWELAHPGIQIFTEQGSFVGRWGSRGDVTLGVGITYSGINNTQLLVEIARKKGNYVPDLSFGTHFFQDLVEARIHYLALYPDEEGNLFNEAFFRDSPSVLLQLLPEHGRLERAVRVIDVEQLFPGCEFNVVMDADKDRALGFVRGLATVHSS